MERENPYSINKLHGGNVLTGGGLKSGLIDFSSSINPFGPGGPALKILKNPKLARQFCENYPEPYPLELSESLSALHNLPEENFFLGAGSTDIIFSLFGVLKPGMAIIAEPSFAEYERAARFNGSAVSRVNTNYGNNFSLAGKSLDLLMDILSGGKKGDSLFIANPSNPAGALTPRATLKKILEVTEKKGIYLVLDESFMDFCEEFSIKDLAGNCKYLIILRSLTKFYAMPGLRVGYMISNKKITSRFLKTVIPWKITGLASAFARASIGDRGFADDTIKKINKNKTDLFNKLTGIKNLQTFPGAANFLLVRIKDRKTKSSELKDYLLRSGILIRNCENFHGLDGAYFRVSVKKKGENDFLIKKLREFF